ncbi:MAG: acyl-CoA synthetase [Acidimicrobiia bacterium]|nr:acyl-CoA synthetase [Acidimicrobiia bacterium]
MGHNEQIRPTSALGYFAANAQRVPDAPLIHYFDQTLTVGHIDEMSDALAVALQRNGFGPGDRLALYLQNVPQFLIGLLAAWKAGGISVSVNPMYRHREARHVLTDSGATAIVCLESLYTDVIGEIRADTELRTVITTSELDFVSDPSRYSVLVESRRQPAAGAVDLLEFIEPYRGQRPPPVEPDPDAVACLVYTSGTTGPSKGAMNTHRNLALAAETYAGMDISDRDVILAVAPLFHITGLTGHVGLSLLVPVPMILNYRFDPAVVLELIERYRATFTVASITVFQALMDHPDAATRDLSSLQNVFSGGQAVAAATVHTYERQMGPYIRIAYGLTETTGPTQMVPPGVRAPIDPTSGALSIGLIAGTTECRIVDDSGAEVPVGTVGELVMRGPQITSGYWQKPEETANAHRDGWFHSGDVGLVDTQGWFYLVDRKKDLINASGYKVWPREVEDVLYEHPSVREAAVVGVPDAYRGETVKAFVSFRRGQSAAEEELVAHCRERLAAFKVPRSVVVLDDLPKTATGKILRRELRQ